VISDYHHWPHDTERAVDFVIGACMLVRREAYEQVGGFDDAFFMYSEEIDWQRRMHAAGWQVLFTPGARLTHLGGASGATQQARIKRHFFDSLDYYEWKHHGIGGLVAVRLAMLVGCALRAVGWTAAMAVPWRGRGRAASKVRMHLWLCWRQLTHWRFVAGFKTLACAGHPSVPQACPAIEARL
jgi:GT2 family glycosyltransferase